MSELDLKSTTGLISALADGNRRALARTISHVENNTKLAQPLLATLYPQAGQAHLVGVTGSPGTGKSTLVNQVAKEYRRRDLSVGIVAIDPTSPFSGGAILGDRVRMRDLAGDPGIFIRSMATRGNLGGLAQAGADVVMVLDAAGFDRVIVETVGVGQSEVEIASTAHTTVVVEAPGFGDEVQAIKAGILEIADIFAVNKADREGVDRAVMALQMMINHGSPGRQQIMHHGRMLPVDWPEPDIDSHVWTPPILETIATINQGTESLVDAIEKHRSYLRQSGHLALRDRLGAATELRMILRDTLLQRLLRQLSKEELTSLVNAVAQRKIDPYGAVQKLLDAHTHSS